MKKNVIIIALIIILISSLIGALVYFNANSNNETEDTEVINENNVDEIEPEEKIITYPILDTGQTKYFDTTGEIAEVTEGNKFFGQDANYQKNSFSYTNNGDGTITDNVTELMWQQTPEVMTYNQAESKLTTFELAGYNDWRLPTVKELYSLIDFSGRDISGTSEDSNTDNFKPFIDNSYFSFTYGNNGERLIDSQYLSNTLYTSTTMNGDATVFGVNFADGRIKGYPLSDMNGEKSFTVMYVRGNTEYGKNIFNDNSDGTISDDATNLMWMQDDNGAFELQGMTWEEALVWANESNYAGYDDWRLPNAKELQSIVDYSRSLDATNSASIDPVFNSTLITVEDGSTNYPNYWTSTTHQTEQGGHNAVYVSFGESLGFMRDRQTGTYQLLDVHGAGSQRSDPKIGDPNEYPYGHGPQGDVIRIYNYVRLVRDIDE